MLETAAAHFLSQKLGLDASVVWISPDGQQHSCIQCHQAHLVPIWLPGDCGIAAGDWGIVAVVAATVDVAALCKGWGFRIGSGRIDGCASWDVLTVLTAFSRGRMDLDTNTNWKMFTPKTSFTMVQLHVKKLCSVVYFSSVASPINPASFTW